MPKDGSLLVLGSGPIGDMATRIALHQGMRVIAVDRVPERLDRAPRRAVRRCIDLDEVDDVGEEVRSLTQGRGTDAVVDAVGMEAHGSPVAEVGQRLFNALPKRLSAAVMNKVGLDRMAAIYTAIDAVRRGGTVSLIGVYGGQSDPMPMLTMFDKQLQFRMGQANVKHWVDDIMPLLLDDADPLGTEDVRHAQGGPRGRARGVRPVPEEDRRHDQGGLQAGPRSLTAELRGRVSALSGTLARCHSTRSSPA